MSRSASEKINRIKKSLHEVDNFSESFDGQIQTVVERHKIEGGNLEYVYVEHFHKEIHGLSRLLQYLLESEENKKYVFFPVRASIEVLLYLEHVFKLAKLNNNELLSLLSVDLAQSAAAVNAAALPDENHPIHATLKKIDVANKILGTNFQLSKIKPSTKPFPAVSSLCDTSQLCLKDCCGGTMYHLYRAYSESNHLRLGNESSISDDIDVDICWALEYFIEIYIKFYEQILTAGSFPQEFRGKLTLIKQPLGIS